MSGRARPALLVSKPAMLRLLAMHSNPSSLHTSANRHACLYPASLLILPSPPVPRLWRPLQLQAPVLLCCPDPLPADALFHFHVCPGPSPYSPLCLVQILQPDCRGSGGRRGSSRRWGGSGPSGSGGGRSRTAGPTARPATCKLQLYRKLKFEAVSIQACSWNKHRSDVTAGC